MDPKSPPDRIKSLVDLFARDCESRDPNCVPIEDYVRLASDVDRPSLVRELILVRLSMTADVDIALCRAEYRCQFPEYAAVVAEAFDAWQSNSTAPAYETWSVNESSIRGQTEATLAKSLAHPLMGSSVAGEKKSVTRCSSCNVEIEIPASTAVKESTCNSCGSKVSVTKAYDTFTASTVRRLGHFELIEKLGAGAFGTVWKARDSKLDRPVAIKIPKREEHGDVERTQFLREARNAAQLKHPNVVSVLEVGETDGTVFIVSDFIRGVSLADWLKSRRPSTKQLCDWMVQIGEALEHAHSKGVIHRDVKPSNIMLDGDNSPHLMDFGLSRRNSRDIRTTADFSQMGTPAYMSPEQAAGKAREADQRSDIYSLGAMFFELLTGELPFRGNAEMVMHQAINDLPPSPRKLDARIKKDLETICLKCLEKQVSKRYQSAQQFVDEIKRFQNGEPIHARPIGPIGRGLRWSQRNPALSAMALSVMLSLVTGTIVSGYFAIRANREAALTVQISGFLVNVFKGSEAIEFSSFMVGGGSADLTKTPVKEIVDRGYLRIQKTLEDEPHIRARVLGTLGEVYMSLGDFESAKKAFSQTIIEQGRFRVDSETYFKTLHNFGVALHGLGEWQEAESKYREVVEVGGEKLGYEHASVIGSRGFLGLLLTAENTSNEKLEGLKLLEELVKDCRRIKDGHKQLQVALSALAAAYINQGNEESATDCLIEIAAIGALHEDTGNNYLPALRSYQEGLNDLRQEKYESALPKLKMALESTSKNLGFEHRFVAYPLFHYARCLREVEGADAVLKSDYWPKLVALFDQIGFKHPKYLLFMQFQVDLYRDLGDQERAIELLQECIRMATQLEQDLPVLVYRYEIGRALCELGRYDQALEIHRGFWEDFSALVRGEREGGWAERKIEHEELTDVAITVARTNFLADKLAPANEVLQQGLILQQTGDLDWGQEGDKQRRLPVEKAWILRFVGELAIYRGQQRLAAQNLDEALRLLASPTKTDVAEDTIAERSDKFVDSIKSLRALLYAKDSKVEQAEALMAEHLSPSRRPDDIFWAPETLAELSGTIHSGQLRSALVTVFVGVDEVSRAKQ